MAARALRRNIGPAKVGSPVNVVIVEDDADCREAIEELLVLGGNRIIPARNGIEALDALKRVDRPALILLDLHTPFLDGVGFLTGLRQRSDRDDFDVVVMSGAVNVEWFARIPGVVAALSKPFDLERIMAIVSEFSARHLGCSDERGDDAREQSPRGPLLPRPPLRRSRLNVLSDDEED